MANTQKQPIRWVRDNIAVSDTGIPYAIWYLSGMPYGMGTRKDKEAVRATHQNLYQAVTGEYKILGLVATTPPGEVVDKMLDGIASPSAEWLNECDLTYEALLELPAGERAHFLVAPLTSLNWKEGTERLKRQATGKAREVLGLPINPPQEESIREWKARAKVIAGRIPRRFKPQPAGIRAMLWITSHLASRGAESSDAFAFSRIEDDSHWVNGRSAFVEPSVDEGAFAEISHRKTAKAQLFKRRYVKVDRHDSEPSYQTFGCLAITPQAGFVFPGSEFINHAAGMRENIDFCIQVKAIPAAKAKERNAKSERNLKDQYEQRTGEQGITGGNSDLDKNATALRDYVAELNSSDREVEIQSTIIFAASGPTAEDAEEDMKELTDFYKGEDWLIDVPYGDQELLFWDFWPCSSPSTAASDYVQFTTGRHFSMGVPLTNDTLGMPRGFRAGINITTGRHSTVLMDLAGLAENDVSGSFAACGELGSGKSVLLKTIASHTIDRGAKLVATDHSDNQEWAKLARSLTTANIIDFYKPHQSLDPLRIWESDYEKRRQTLSLITMMLGVGSKDESYMLIDSELDRLFGKEGGVSNMYELQQHFKSGNLEEADRPIARKIARQMGIFAKLDYAQTFFDPTLPVVDFSSQATVFCTHGMELPNEKELYSNVQNAMTPAKEMGRAAYAYLAEIGSHIMYEDDSQEVLFLVDEAHHMTASPAGSETIKKAVKTGRKHKAAVGLGTHSSQELGDEDLRGLIPQRFIFRTRDKKMARTNLQWLDETYATDEYLDVLMKDTAPMDSTGKVPMERRGECFYRDPFNRIGKIKIEIPRSEKRAMAVLTSPPKTRVVEELEEHEEQGENREKVPA